MQLQEALHVIRGCLLSPYGTHNQQRLDEAWHEVNSTLNDQRDYIKKLESRQERYYMHPLGTMTITGLQARLAYIRKLHGDLPVGGFNWEGACHDVKDVVVNTTPSGKREAFIIA